MYNENNHLGLENKNEQMSGNGSVGNYNFSNGYDESAKAFKVEDDYAGRQSYAYNRHMQEQSGTKGKKKKHTFAKVMAFVLCACLLLGVGAGSALFMSGYFEKKEMQPELSRVEKNQDTNISSPYQAGGETNQNQQGVLSPTTTAVSALPATMDVAGIVKEAMPSIVSVTSTITAKYPTMFGQMYEKSGTDAGSGIIIGENDQELLIATNYHVIGNADSGSIHIGFCDGTSATAGVKGTDKDMDLAIVAVAKSDVNADTMSAIRISTIGDSDQLQLGEPVIAIGNGLGYGQSVSYGIVSALSREIQSESGDTNTYIQTDAAINPGNSGGALLNGKGELIGITSAKIADSTVEGMGFAIPVSSAKPILDNLMTVETKVALSEDARGYLGVRVATPTGVEGAYIVEVSQMSAAGKAGLKVGDIITGADGSQITSAEDLTEMLQYYEAGREVKLDILRKGLSGYGQETIGVTLEGMQNDNP